MQEVTVSFSIGVKCNLGEQSFENVNFNLTRTEKYDVSEMSDEAVELFYDERYQILRKELTAEGEKLYHSTSTFGDPELGYGDDE